MHIGFGDLTIRAALDDLNKLSSGVDVFEYYSIEYLDCGITIIITEEGLNSDELSDWDMDDVINELNFYRKDIISEGCKIKNLDECIFDLTNLYDIFDELYTLEWTEFDKKYQENSIECNFVLDDLNITIMLGFDSDYFEYYSQCTLETEDRSYENNDEFSNITELVNNIIEDLNVIRRLSKNETVSDFLSKITTILSKYNN